MSSRLRSLRRSAKVAALATMIAAPALHAASGTWNLDANGSWGVGTNWTGGIPGVLDDVAALTNNISAARTVTLDGSRTLGTLQIGDADSTAAFTLTAVPTGGALTFDVSSGSALLNFSSAAAIANTLTVPLILNDSLRIAITGNSTGTQVINGPISGAQAVTIDANSQAAANGLGGIQFNGFNTFSGGLTTTQVRVQAPNVFALGTGTVTVNSTGQIFATAAGAYGNNLVLTGLGWQEATGLLGALRSDVNNTFNGNISV